MTPEQLAIVLGLVLLALALFCAARILRNLRREGQAAPVAIPDTRNWRHLREIRNSAPDRS